MIGHGLFYTTASKLAIMDSERLRIGQRPQEIQILFRMVYYHMNAALGDVFNGYGMLLVSRYALGPYADADAVSPSSFHTGIVAYFFFKQKGKNGLRGMNTAGNFEHKKIILKEQD
jgi:hypothetical protein